MCVDLKKNTLEKTLQTFAGPNVLEKMLLFINFLDQLVQHDIQLNGIQCTSKSYSQSLIKWISMYKEY